MFEDRTGKIFMTPDGKPPVTGGTPITLPGGGTGILVGGLVSPDP